MNNFKKDLGLIGEKYWPHVAYVDVLGRKNLRQLPENGTESEIEAVIQSWDEIVVLKVSDDVPFLFGFIRGKSFQYLKETVSTVDGMFGVRQSSENTRLFVIPKSLDHGLDLEIVAYAKESNPKYNNLPLY